MYEISRVKNVLHCQEYLNIESFGTKERRKPKQILLIGICIHLHLKGATAPTCTTTNNSFFGGTTVTNHESPELQTRCAFHYVLVQVRR